MAEALSQPSNRYFCHSCSNTASVLGQNLTCPECQSEFIEEVNSYNSNERSSTQDSEPTSPIDPLSMLSNSLRTFSDFRRDAEMNSFPFSLSLDEMDGLSYNPTEPAFTDWGDLMGGGATRNRNRGSNSSQQTITSSSTSSNGTQPQQGSAARQRYNLRIRRNRPSQVTITNNNNTTSSSSRNQRRSFGGVLSLLGLLEMSDGMRADDPNSPEHVNFVFDSFPNTDDDSGFNLDIRRFDAIIGSLLGQLESTNSGAPPADATTIRRLPQVHINKDDISNERDCPVCMERFKLDENAKQLPCKHLFHSLCIDQWLKLHNTCPVCRKNVESNSNNCVNTGSTSTSAFHARSRPQPMNTEDEIIDLTLTDDP